MIKNRKLLFQIGIALTCVFLVVILSTVVYVFNKSRDIYLNAKNEMIEKDLARVEKELNPHLSSEVIDYFVDNKEEVQVDLQNEEYAILADISGTEFYDGSIISDDQFSQLSDEQKLVYAKDQKSSISIVLATGMYNSGYNALYCIAPIDDENAFVIADDEWYSVVASEYNTEEDDKSGNLKFGEIIPFDVHEIKGLENAIKNHSDETIFHLIVEGHDEAYYVGYKPLYDADGDLTFLLVAEYDWSEMYSDMFKDVIIKFPLNLVLMLLIAAALILLVLYFVAIVPLKKVGNAVDVYMVTKNSKDVEKQLVSFKTRNEIGALAENIGKMTKEIDRYTEDNINLASEKAKVETELKLAASIQTQSLIKDFPKSDIYEVYASMTPAKAVGGDFYDVFDIDEDHLALVIADVSGKGMPAALFMMSALTAIKNCCTPGRKPSEVISQVNEGLVKRDIMDMFVTIWLGILDKKTGILTTSSAGHEYPAINTTGKFEMFRDKHGLVAGAMPGVKYRDHEIQLEKNSTVFVYTDGVPEATNGQQQMFGEDRMVEALNVDPSAAPMDILSNVKNAVDEFVGEAEQFDDLTMLCIRYYGESN